MVARRGSPALALAERGGLSVLLIRHGSTELDASGSYCGARLDPPLDENGHRQVAALRRRLAGKVARVYSSPQRRALETADALGETPATIIPELREVDFGLLEASEIAGSRARTFLELWRSDPAHTKFPGGESLSALAERVTRGMDWIVIEHQPSVECTVAAVTHDVAQAAFLCHALGEPLQHYRRFCLAPATANLVHWDGFGWSLLDRNL